MVCRHCRLELQKSNDGKHWIPVDTVHGFSDCPSGTDRTLRGADESGFHEIEWVVPDLTDPTAVAEWLSHPEPMP